MNNSDARLFFLRLITWHKRAIHRLFISANADEIQANRLVMLGWLALIGFPLYYWIWSELYPQPYENLILRLVGVAVTVPFFFARQIQQKKWFDTYFFITITYIFPFFFTFMFLMNDGSQVWAESLLIAVIVLFHFDAKFALASFSIGVAVALITNASVGEMHLRHYGEMLYNVPIIVFAILSTSIVRIGRGLLMDEKLHGMASALAVVAHELRTPLRSVDASARGIKRYLPALAAFYGKYHSTSDIGNVDAKRIAMIGPVLERMQADVQYMNIAIDLLLVNTRYPRQETEVRKIFQIDELLLDALARYPFEDDHQRSFVHVEIRTGFSVNGNRDLCMMVVFNLLKNALRAIAKVGKGKITIVVDENANVGQVIVHDTGCGIPSNELPYIFRRFYSYPPNTGTGIGLAFCRDVLAAWGGTIEARSVLHSYTEFLLRFPLPKPR